MHSIGYIDTPILVAERQLMQEEKANEARRQVETKFTAREFDWAATIASTEKQLSEVWGICCGSNILFVIIFGLFLSNIVVRSAP